MIDLKANIKFVDLQSQWEEIKDEAMPVIEKVLEKGDFILGDSVRGFEENFASYCGTEYAVGVDNGTNALELALRTLGIGEGDEVIIPANTFIATAFAVSEVGARIVLCDVYDDTMLIDVSKIESLITPKTKAVIPVHLFGQQSNVKHITTLSWAHGFRVIEDSSQSHGSSTEEKTDSAMQCYSLYPSKNLGACGDAGIITTNNKDYYEHLIKLRAYGSSVKYHHDFIGKNSRLDTIQAAILNIKLNYLDEWNRKRRWIAKQYLNRLWNVGDLELPTISEHNYHVFHQYVIKTKHRDELKEHLFKNQIFTMIHYPIPISKSKCYEGYDFGSKNSFPITQRLSETMLSLPIHPYLTLEQIEYITDSIKSFYG